MGGCASSPVGDGVGDSSSPEALRSKALDKSLREDEKKMVKEVKLLLLGE